MKVSCPFCKVEYSVRDGAARSFECAVCGHCWRAQTRRSRARLWIFLLSCAVLLLAVFSFIALLRYEPPAPAGPLAVRMDSAVAAADGIAVSGVVANNSEALYGVPDLVVVMKDAAGAELASQKFTPPAPLLDAGETVAFSVYVANVPADTAKISVELNK
ncbi:MAG: zinc-ribbon domain-containing protein [Alphaproteobacteria bacterium]|nr:zinc-ribbon domain-containing protein [Alphaproteobacteria bacterium]